MIENPQPTRAEASDVANAIWDGTDAVMLSAESAVGRHPLAAVQWLARIAEDADMNYRPRLGRLEDSLADQLARRTDVAVAFAACRTAGEVGARAIVVFTEGGGSARMVSRLAANRTVIGATTDLPNARRMGLLRGVEAMVVQRKENSDEMVEMVERRLQEQYSLAPGEQVVFTLGLPLWRSGNTNTMKVITY
jgi:pyruvate kinase